MLVGALSNRAWKGWSCEAHSSGGQRGPPGVQLVCLLTLR